MKGSSSIRRVGRQRRRKSIRGKVSGEPGRPRLSVFRSLKHTYAQVIDDVGGVTLVSASSLSDDVRKELGKGDHTKTDVSKAVGKVLARLALEKGIKQVRFDRGGYLYHGRVQALAEAAREGGLEF
ncbi:MAG: 50S ribosomal protein L18 [Candidatus Eisenbacteria bacterium]|nr:50S ribosomal protein L18 [Candidatus Eisenbacteria bacterium]